MLVVQLSMKPCKFCDVSFVDIRDLMSADIIYSMCSGHLLLILLVCYVWGGLVVASSGSKHKDTG